MRCICYYQERERDAIVLSGRRTVVPEVFAAEFEKRERAYCVFREVRVLCRTAGATGLSWNEIGSFLGRGRHENKTESGNRGV